MTTTTPTATGSSLTLITLLIPTYDSAITYFTQTLNFTLTTDTPSTSTRTGEPKRWVVVHPPSSSSSSTTITSSSSSSPSSCGILLAQADTPEQKSLIGKQWAGRVALFLRVSEAEFESRYEGMKGKGVVFEGSPRSEEYGRVVVFRDVWGNRWDLLGSG